MSVSLSEKQSSSTPPASEGLRVMMVDDSVVIRGLVSKWLSECSEVRKVDTYRNGRVAVDSVVQDDPDVVILDIEMPEMDGIEALQEIKKLKPNLPVIMASSLTQRNAEISLRALSLGATDYVPKPESNSGVTTSVNFRRDLISKAIELGLRSRKTPYAARPQAAIEAPARPIERQTPPSPAETVGQASAGEQYKLVQASPIIPRILAIGSSTGGPIALSSLLTKLGAQLDHCPIVIAQHMPHKFTEILARQLCEETGRPCAEGIDGEEVRKGQIYVAPGGKHMTVKKDGAIVKIALDDGPPINFCKPAVDPLFTSVSEVYGNATLSTVLTGMGSDGCEGAKDIIAKGGTVLAQDEDSSVVWGMPGAVANAGVCAAILPLDELPMKITKLMRGMRT